VEEDHYMIVAGDVGGTNTRLAFFTMQGEVLHYVVEETFPSRDYANLVTLVNRFVSSHHLRPERACFGVAGPVQNGRSEATNLPWIVDARRLAAALHLDHVGLINDLEAAAYGLATLTPEDYVILNEGNATATGNMAVIAAGTGLGEAGLYWDGRRHHPFATEGGHATFAPNTPLQIELHGHLLREFDHVSWERVVSGPGLHNLYRFLRDTGRGEEPAWLRQEMHQGDPSAAISRAALAEKSPLCMQALDLFVTLYGAEAGNLALKIMATGGVFIGGGIAPKILQKLIDGPFMAAFTAKGRLQDLLQEIPVRVILNDKIGLQGAARLAALQDR
jgi:glucokinase